MGDLTPLGISVLALLNERPMHPYEMYLTLLERHQQYIVKLRPGSLYHTVNGLAERELVRVTGTERCGNRPERTTYEVTAAGREALIARLGEIVRTPANEYPAFLVGLAEAHNLPRADVIARLRARCERIDEIIDDIEAFLAGAASGVETAYLLAPRFVQDSYRAERAWIAALADRIENKEIEWPTP